MWIAADDIVERQVFFNHKLEVIAKFEPSDNKYASYLKYLTENASSSAITWDNVKDHVPFVEVVIVRNISSGSYSYKITFDSPDILTARDWKGIRDATSQALADFELEKYGTANRLFYPELKEKEEISRKSSKLVQKKRLTLALVNKYMKLVEEIKDVLQKKATVPEMAKRLGTSEKTVRENLYGPLSHRPTPAPLAKIIVLESAEAKELGLNTPERLVTKCSIAAEDVNSIKPNGTFPEKG